eukprot:4700760-Pleurochrysis_carterae.AAC.2
MYDSSHNQLAACGKSCYSLSTCRHAPSAPPGPMSKAKCDLSQYEFDPLRLLLMATNIQIYKSSKAENSFAIIHAEVIVSILTLPLEGRAGSSRSLDRLFQPRTPELACFTDSDSLLTGNHQSYHPGRAGANGITKIQPLGGWELARARGWTRLR